MCYAHKFVSVSRCWERNINMGYWWIIRSPILFAYLVRLSVSLSLSLIFVFNFLSLHLDNVLKTIQNNLCLGRCLGVLIKIPNAFVCLLVFECV